MRLFCQKPWNNYKIININHFWLHHIILLFLCLCFLWLDIYAVRCCAAVPHFSSCLWPNLLGFSTKMKKVYLSHQNADIYFCLDCSVPVPHISFSLKKKRFFDQKKFISTKKWRYFCKSRLDRAGHFTALSHISAADFTISLSNHISKGKYFLVKSFGIGDKITKVFGKSSFEYWHLFVLSIFRNDLGTTVSCDIAHTMICITIFLTCGLKPGFGLSLAWHCIYADLHMKGGLG